MNGRILYTRSPVARRVGRWPEASFGCHGARAGTAVSRTSNDFNQLTGVGGATLAYDSNGSMTTDDQGHTLTYDAWNRLVSVKNGGTTLATYAYDGAGRRVTATASGTTTDSYFSGSVVAEDYRGGQAYERTVAAPGYVDAVLLRDKDTDANGTLDQRVHFTADANANITGVLSASATVLQHQFYDLEVDAEKFSVMLSFNNVPERLTIPLQAITIFADPSVNFALQFQPLSEDDEEDVHFEAEELDLDKDDKQKKKGEVVSLDSFRKKDKDKT